MSKRLPATELERHRQRWIGPYQPITAKECDAWRTDWSRGLERLPYLRALRTTAPMRLENIVQLRCELNQRAAAIDSVKADIERIWEHLSSDLDAVHAFEVHEEGFRFVYGALDDRSCYFTGSMNVVLKAA